VHALFGGDHLILSYLHLILCLTLLACALKIVVNKRRLAVWPVFQMRGSSILIFQLQVLVPPSHRLISLSHVSLIFCEDLQSSFFNCRHWCSHLIVLSHTRLSESRILRGSLILFFQLQALVFPSQGLVVLSCTRIFESRISQGSSILFFQLQALVPPFHHLIAVSHEPRILRGSSILFFQLQASVLPFIVLSHARL
jgi:hypothetical protein